MKMMEHINTQKIAINKISSLKKNVITIILILIGLVSNSQTGIGTLIPDISSQLEVASANKGVLLPNVTLKSETDQTPISGGKPTTSLLIYNTGLDPDFPTKGFMFWNGSRWRLLTDATSIKTKIEGTLIAKSAVMIPNTYTAGVDYNGVLEVQYNGGNGGYYSEEEPYEYNDLHFTLQPGQATGIGKLSYLVKGKPKVGNPTTIDNVPIRFLNDTLGHMNIGGANTTSVNQYTLYRSIEISLSSTDGSKGANNGYGGTKLEWRKDNDKKIQSIELPETGAYVFSFRFYGSVEGTKAAAPFYMSALKQAGSTPSDRPTDVLLDIAEITMVKPSDYSNLTYSVNLTATGQAGDRIYFKLAEAALTNPLKWTLSNGNDGVNYSTLANRSSMIFWKL